MGEQQDRNLEAVRTFYDAGPAADDTDRRQQFADDFVWHVPGDTDLSGDYANESYFNDMPARMQPLDRWSMTIDHLAANADLVVSVGRVSGRRLNRTIDAVAGHVFRLDAESRIVEAWGWCDDQGALDEFFAEPPG
jgi:ketosteroid isomerase-like protein